MIRSRTSFKGARAAAGNWWEAGGATGAVAAYQPKGAASYVASLLDLSSNGNDATAPVSAPGWNATDGWVHGGIDEYLNTGVLVTGAGWSLIARYSDASFFSSLGTAGIGFVVGTRTDTNRRLYVGGRDTDGARIYGYGDLIAVAGDNSGGVRAIAGGQAYYNGAAEGTPTAWNGNPTETLLIGRERAANGNVSGYMTGNIQAVAIYNNTLTADMVAAVTAAMQAL